MAKQIYENYWNLTNAFTDYNGDCFKTALRLCVDFIDENNNSAYSSEKYKKLQNILFEEFGTSEISLRKAINQLVKLGFINTHLASYSPLAKDYLAATTDRKRTIILSKIVYSNSSFKRSVYKDCNLHQINFLIKTLMNHGKISKDEILALMLVDIAEYPDGFLTPEELQQYLNKAIEIGFINRKYNQFSHLCNLLGKLENLQFVNDILYFKGDAVRIFGENLPLSETKKRDPYLHFLYKKQLKEESEAHVNAAKCMVEDLAYPVLIASHIKPFSKSDEYEAYDVNNGFLLSRNIDSLFDLGYITFDNKGAIIVSDILDNEVKLKLYDYRINPVFINKKRLDYLEYHRANIFDKRYN